MPTMRSRATVISVTSLHPCRRTGGQLALPSRAGTNTAGASYPSDGKAIWPARALPDLIGDCGPSI